MSPLTALNLRDWLTSREAAIMMGCSIEYMHRLNYLGALHPEKVGSTCMYRKVEIERYIETHPQLNRRERAS